MEEKLPALREKFRESPESLDSIDATQKEIDMYRKYSDWYGYVFYVGQAGEKNHRCKIWDAIAV
jgi:hypothetical protein